MDGMEDQVLVRRVASGDERALSALYDRYAGLIFGSGVRYLGDRGLAEDRITRNQATDLIRRRKARIRTVGGDLLFEPEGDDPSGELSRSFDVASALSRLSLVHREVIILAYFEGLSQSEISRRTGTPLGTVKSRTTAALRALREDLDEDRGSGDE